MILGDTFLSLLPVEHNYYYDIKPCMNNYLLHTGNGDIGAVVGISIGVVGVIIVVIITVVIIVAIVMKKKTIRERLLRKYFTVFIVYTQVLMLVVSIIIIINLVLSQQLGIKQRYM